MPQADSRPQAWIIIVATVAALALRCWFVATATVDIPVRGDAREYVAYATNLVRFHVFSGATGNMPVLPDSYRDPGYPIFLAPWIASVADTTQRYLMVAYIQAMLGALTVAAYLLMARRWVTAPWLGLAAILLSIWPHSITMPAYLLSETLLGFLVAAGLACLSEGWARRSTSCLIAGGLLFGCAGLTNAVVAPFLPLVAASGWLLRPQLRRQLFLVLIASLLLPSCWLIRNLTIDGSNTNSSSRAMINLVQGSWPEYHDAWHAALRREPAGVAMNARIDKAVSVAVESRQAGLADIGQRIRSRPLYYAGWYVSKPWLLWGWDMRIAAEPLYVFPTRNSPLDARPPAQFAVQAMKAANPWVALAALLGCLLAIVTRHAHLMILPALLLLYVTGVYGLFQSEPRYSAPFRGTECVLAVAGVAWLVEVTLRTSCRWWSQGFQKRDST